MKILLRNKSTNEIYQHINDNEFQNITTGKFGTVTTEQAKILVVNERLTNFANENPVFVDLIQKLQLSHDPTNH